MKKIFQSWRQLLSIQIGGVICLPIIMIGQAIGSMFGFLPALLAVGLGNLFLMGFAIVACMMGVKKRRPTSEIAKEYFGTKGGRFFSFLLSFSMIGWFGIQLNFIIQSLIQVLALIGVTIAFSPIILNVILGVLISICALFGMKGIRILATLSIPFLFGVLAFAFFIAPLSLLSIAHIGTIINMQGVSMVIGGGMAAVIDFPTYFQHAKTEKHGIIASVLLFGLAMPFIEIVGIALGVCYPDFTLLSCLIAGGGFIWSLFVVLFLIFAGWTTNNTNIYSASINSKAFLIKIPQKFRILIFGFIGTILSTFGLLAHLTFVLSLMGIVLGSMGATIIASFLMDKFLKYEINKKGKIFNSITFAIALNFGILSFMGIFTLTYLPVLDSFLAAFILTSGFRLLNNKKVIMKEVVDETN